MASFFQWIYRRFYNFWRGYDMEPGRVIRLKKNKKRVTINNLSQSEEELLSYKRWKVIKELDKGGFDKIFVVENLDEALTNRRNQLAVKIINILRETFDPDGEFKTRQINILTRISHPHILHIHGILKRKDKYFVFMRHAENGDLLDYMDENGGLPEDVARHWCRQLALAVQYLHEMGIAHRHIKCEHLLITEKMNIKLTSFGLARYFIDHKGNPLRSDTYRGTVSYTAPEVLRCKPYDPKIADMWSVGVVLFQMVNNEVPFSDNNIKAIYCKQISKTYRFQNSIEEILSPEVKDAIDSMMEPDTTKRWTIEQLVYSDWIDMHKKINQWTVAEKEALEKAKQTRKSLSERRSSMMKSNKPHETLSDEHTFSPDDNSSM